MPPISVKTVRRQVVQNLFGWRMRVDPYGVYRYFRERDPVLWVPELLGRGAWVVTGHREANAILRDNRFIKEGYKSLDPETLAEVPAARQMAMEGRQHSMLFRDPPDHTRLRGLVSLAFTPRVLERLRPHITAIARDLADRVARAGRIDLIADFAFPLPVTVIAELLGVPAEMRHQFHQWSGPLTLSLNPLASSEQLDRSEQAGRALNQYFQETIAERRQSPRDDLISGLIHAHDDEDRLSDEELVITCRLLLVAGHETTVNLIGNGMLALLRHPEHFQWLRAHPEAVPLAVEELLRYDSPVQLTVRFVGEALELEGRRLQQGQLVLLMLGGANRDPRQFADPNRLDLTRHPNPHLAFSAGIHYCLGAALARMEGQIAIETLLDRFPGMRRVPGRLKWRENLTLRGLKTLPVIL